MTARSLVLAAERRFRRARLHFGHGTDNARDEAVFLVFHALGLPFDCSDRALDEALAPEAVARAEALVAARIATRQPAAYLTGRMWFAGHEFEVTRDVLVPRSPLAELIGDRFTPWMDPALITRILDIGTGSGCIGLAAAMAFPESRVDLTDISPAALAVAIRNCQRLGLEGRCQLHLADLFPSTQTAPYDLILANPPYVPIAEREALPPEYAHEPAIALFSPDAGLAHIRRILAGAARRLSPHGILVLDAGGTWEAVDAAFGKLAIVWVDLRHGGDGVAVFSRTELARLA